MHHSLGSGLGRKLMCGSPAFQGSQFRGRQTVPGLSRSEGGDRSVDKVCGVLTGRATSSAGGLREGHMEMT